MNSRDTTKQVASLPPEPPVPVRTYWRVLALLLLVAHLFGALAAGSRGTSIDDVRFLLGLKQVLLLVLLYAASLGFLELILIRVTSRRARCTGIFVWALAFAIAEQYLQRGFSIIFVVFFAGSVGVLFLAILRNGYVGFVPIPDLGTIHDPRAARRVLTLIRGELDHEYTQWLGVATGGGATAVAAMAILLSDSVVGVFGGTSEIVQRSWLYPQMLRVVLGWLSLTALIAYGMVLPLHRQRKVTFDQLIHFARQPGDNDAEA
jgi:hypothetical protein